MDQLSLFTDDQVATSGPAKPWRLKWGVAPDSDTHMPKNDSSDAG